MGNICLKNTHNSLQTIVDKLELEDLEKNVIKLRYVQELDELEKNSYSSSCVYNITNCFLTTLSIILPGLLSIQKINTNYGDLLFWIGWGMSLCITLLNGYIKLFKIDRNYYFYNYNYEKFISEGWNYIELGGVYNTKDNHQLAYKRFMGNVEKLKTDNLNTLYSDVKSSDNVKKKKRKDVNTVSKTDYMAINTEINTEINNEDSNIENKIDS